MSAVRFNWSIIRMCRSMEEIEAFFALDPERQRELERQFQALGALPPGSIVRMLPPDLPQFLGPEREVAIIGERQLEQTPDGTWSEYIPERGPALPPSDTGIDGAIPLPPMEQRWGDPDDGVSEQPWDLNGVSDDVWADQNRRINELLMRRTP